VSVPNWIPDQLRKPFEWLQDELTGVQDRVVTLATRLSRVPDIIEGAFEKAVWFPLEYVWKPVRTVFEALRSALAGSPGAMRRFAESVQSLGGRTFWVIRAVVDWTRESVLLPLWQRSEDAIAEMAQLASDLLALTAALADLIDALGDLVTRYVIERAIDWAEPVADRLDRYVDEHWEDSP
jgi:hypothetical protein